METYTLPSWFLRRCLGELKEKLEDNAGALSWTEAIRSPPLLLLKIGLTGGAYVLPDKPNPSQIEGVPDDLGKVLDLFDSVITGDKKVTAFGPDIIILPDDFHLCSVHGHVYVSLAFWGRDP